MANQNKTKPVKEIAEHCQVSITQAEHWFRKDKYFAIPQPSEWYKLKEILNIILKIIWFIKTPEYLYYYLYIIKP